MIDISKQKTKYSLTTELEKEYVPLIENFFEEVIGGKNPKLELTGSRLNPTSLGEILTGYGYSSKETSIDKHTADFVISFVHKGLPDLQITGCGLTFELELIMLNNI